MTHEEMHRLKEFVAILSRTFPGSQINGMDFDSMILLLLQLIKEHDEQLA